MHDKSHSDSEGFLHKCTTKRAMELHETARRCVCTALETLAVVVVVFTCDLDYRLPPLHVLLSSMQADHDVLSTCCNW